jgi:phosphatidylinositol alpha-1,6-mannosyltransferase
VLARVPEAALLIVGGGKHAQAVREMSGRLGLATWPPRDGAAPGAAGAAGAAARETAAAARSSVYFTGPVPQGELLAHYAAGDVFAMPCRTRRAGLDVEGLGIVYLEASAAGLPVVGGDSGGAPDAILAGETGYVVGGRDVRALADRLTALLLDPAHARAMGEKGRAWVERDWNWDLVASRLRALIDG